MSCYEKFTRIQIRQTDIAGELPTVPPFNPATPQDWDDPSILATDLLDGELFVNTTDKRVFIRANDTIQELVLGGNAQNFFTIAASLNGNIIEFDRNDTTNAYSVDLTPIINAITNSILYEIGPGDDSTQRKGVGNVANGDFDTVLGGEGNVTNANVSHNTIVGGKDNKISHSETNAGYSFIGGGLNNELQGDAGVIVGGENNKVEANGSLSHVFIGGGRDNTIGPNNASLSFIGAGDNNLIDDARGSSIIAGENNEIIGLNDTHIVGSNITVSSANGDPANHTWVNNLNINDTPDEDNTIDSVLVRDANGFVKTRAASSIGGGSGGDNTYQMTLGYRGTTLNANTTYIAGGIVNVTAQTLFNQRPSRQHIVPRSGSVVNVDIITIVSGTKAGTGTPSIELHNLTQSTSTVIVATNLYSSGGLVGDSRIDQYTLTTPFSVDKGDIIQIRVVTPSWSTSPVGVWQQFHLDIEE